MIAESHQSGPCICGRGNTVGTEPYIEADAGGGHHAPVTKCAAFWNTEELGVLDPGED